MKQYNTDHSEALSQFGKDKRLHKSSQENTEHRSSESTTTKREGTRRSFNHNNSGDHFEHRVRRDGERSTTRQEGEHRTFGRKFNSEGNEHRFGEHGATKREGNRRSFNPNFTDDNRVRGNHNTEHEQEHKEWKPRTTDHKFERSSNRFAERGERGEHSRSERPFHSRDNREERGGEHRSFTRGEHSAQHTEKRGYARKESSYSPRGTKRDSFSHTSEDKPKDYPKFNPNRSLDEIRLNRFVAQSGVCSRREADSYIQAGLVSVNGQIITELGTKVKYTDEVKFNGERLQGEKNVYLILNKPKGYVTTLEDDHADKTVMELVDNACKERIYPVGRLDKNSLGLLLFTNDGDITRALTHPSYKKKKIYEVTLDKALTRADFDKLAEGVTLEDGEAFFDEIQWLDDNKKSVGVEIHSGRNRIVRRMFESLGYKVTKLDRVYYAGLTKKNLKRGAWRFLTEEEVAHLKSGQYE